jgi:tRNA pseudouridine synthase 10
VLDIVTQAGTYVKELVHGEFGRTEPSISSIIGAEIDIAALDVMNIDLDFPKSMIR